MTEKKADISYIVMIQTFIIFCAVCLRVGDTKIAMSGMSIFKKYLLCAG
jgi:hypothetical protein